MLNNLIKKIKSSTYFKAYKKDSKYYSFLILFIVNTVIGSALFDLLNYRLMLSAILNILENLKIEYDKEDIENIFTTSLQEW